MGIIWKRTEDWHESPPCHILPTLPVPFCIFQMYVVGELKLRIYYSYCTVYGTLIQVCLSFDRPTVAHESTYFGCFKEDPANREFPDDTLLSRPSDMSSTACWKTCIFKEYTYSATSVFNTDSQYISQDNSLLHTAEPDNSNRMCEP